jgi:hypothetical protein
MLGVMGKGTTPAAQRKPRTWQELTMDEAWELVKVKPKGWNDRI